MSQTTFDRLGLPADLVAALAAQHITEPFAIQGLTLPDALDGRDILGRAPTGSGKTLAFGLPALTRLAQTDQAIKRRPRGLILSPTRELADQIQRELAPLATVLRRRVAAVYGGASMGKQITALRKGVDLLVACPGRLLDLIEQGEVSLDQVEIAVVDEADRMADMGFLPDVRRILDQTMGDRQTLLFSATLDGDVKTLTDRYQHDPALHEIGDPEPDLSTVHHRFIKVRKPERMDLAADLIDDAGSTVVFVRTRHGVDRLARQLKQRGVKAGYIHGGRTQSQRSRALELFTNGKVDALVATDVAARGIHVDGVACVLHYDPPADVKDYVHRSGRTARAGAGGTVISLLDPSQVKPSQKMQRELGIEADLESPPPAQPRSRPAVTDADIDGGSGRNGNKHGKPSKAKSNGAGKANGRGTGSAKGKPAKGRPSKGTSAGKPKGDTRGNGRSAEAGDERSTTEATRPSRGPRGGSKPGGKPRTGGKPGRRDSSGPSGSGKAAGKGRGRTDDDRSGQTRSEGSGGTEETRSPRPRKAKPASPGKARAKRGAAARSGKRTGRSRPPNRKGKLGAKGRRSTSSGS